MTIDQLRGELGLDRIDLLKIDVDGYETRVLRGARETLRARAVRNAIVEFVDYWIDRGSGSTDEMLDLLASGDLAEVHDPVAGMLLGPSDDRIFRLR